MSDPSSGTWIAWVFAPAAGVLGFVGFFVALSYVLANVFTRGSFGWPGFGQVVREALLMSFTQSILPLGWAFFAGGAGNGGAGSAASSARPIVLVHGYVQNRSNFVWLARYLGRRGLGPLFGFNYFSLAPIEDSARALAIYVEGVAERTGAAQVDLVCHSLGGLVARTYVDLLGGGSRVRRVVTLGTPHSGVLHATLGFGKSTRDMHPSSGFLARLHSALSPSSVRYHSIYSTHDNIVYPSTVSSLGARGRDVVVRGYGHFAILFSEEVAAHVYDALTAEESAESAVAA